MNPLYTLGHSNHPLASFLGLLERHEINVVADVRSQPYSRHVPWFRREELEQALKAAGRRYLFLGRELGARRGESACYVNGRVSYERVARTAEFLNGLEILKKETSGARVAILCAEKDPLDCHRTILVARHARAFADVRHILADGSIETHAEVEQRLRRCYRLFDADLFLSPEMQLAEAYARRAGEIAYAGETPAPEGA